MDEKWARKKLAAYQYAMKSATTTGIEIVKGKDKELAMIQGYKEKGCQAGKFNLASVLIGV